jgi:hypothetical protein
MFACRIGVFAALVKAVKVATEGGTTRWHGVQKSAQFKTWEQACTNG